MSVGSEAVFEYCGGADNTTEVLETGYLNVVWWIGEHLVPKLPGIWRMRGQELLRRAGCLERLSKLEALLVRDNVGSEEWRLEAAIAQSEF